MKNGRQAGAENYLKFLAWLRERHKAGDWSDYVRGGRLSRKDIYTECEFARSALEQNRLVAKLLRRWEEVLRARAVLPPDKGKKAPQGASEAAMAVVDHREAASQSQGQKRIKALEERNAALLAQVRDLETQLKHYQHLDQHLSRTGQILPQ